MLHKILLFFLLFFVNICYAQEYALTEHILYASKSVEEDKTTMETIVATKKDYLHMQLKGGEVVIELYPHVAPNHVKRIKELTNQGFYDGLKFHRVIKGFVAQTGDPTGIGNGGTNHKLKAEFSDIPHKKGIVSMARAINPDSADSQFFICLEDSPHLDNKYTVFGIVVSGMEHVSNIKSGDGHNNGFVEDPDIVISMKVVNH